MDKNLFANDFISLVKSNKKNYMITFGILVIVGLIVYSVSYISQIPNPDAIQSAVKQGWTWEAMLGRFMLKFWQDLTGWTVNPTMNAIICIFEMSFIAVMINIILGIKDLWKTVIIGLLILINPQVQGVITFYFCASFYFLSYAIMMAALLILLNVSNHKYNKNNILSVVAVYLVAVILITVSLGTYQAYLSSFAVVTLLWLIKEIYYSESKIPELIIRLIKIGAGFICGVASYLICNSIFLKSHNMELTSDRGFSSMGTIDFSSLGTNILKCYYRTVSYFFGNDMIRNSYGWITRKKINFLYAVCCVLIIAIYLMALKKKRGIGKCLLSLMFIILLPIAIFVLSIVAQDAKISAIMLPSICAVYFLPIILYDIIEHDINLKGNIVKTLLITVSSVVIFMLILIVNDSQVYARHNMDKTKYVAQSIAMEVEKVPEYETTKRVCVIGTMEDGNYPEVYKGLEYGNSWQVASYRVIWPSYAVSETGWIYFIKHYLGVTLEPVEADDMHRIIATDEFKNMKCFPYENSVSAIDDIIVVKLSDVSEDY